MKQCVRRPLQPLSTNKNCWKQSSGWPIRLVTMMIPLTWSRFWNISNVRWKWSALPNVQPATRQRRPYGASHCWNVLAPGSIRLGKWGIQAEQTDPTSNKARLLWLKNRTTYWKFLLSRMCSAAFSKDESCLCAWLPVLGVHSFIRPSCFRITTHVESFIFCFDCKIESNHATATVIM